MYYVSYSQYEESAWFSVWIENEEYGGFSYSEGWYPAWDEESSGDDEEESSGDDEDDYDHYVSMAYYSADWSEYYYSDDGEEWDSYTCDEDNYCEWGNEAPPEENLEALLGY